MSVATLCTICFVLTGFAASGVRAETMAKPTLTFAGPSFCDSFNPLVWPRPAEDLYGIAYEPFIRQDGQGVYKPGLATSWKMSPGNKVLALTLRSNARFSDGSSVTARTVKTYLEYYMTQGAFQGFQNTIRSVAALGKYGLRITLKQPIPQIEQVLRTMVVASPGAVADAKAHPNSPEWSKKTFGAGPYVLDPSHTVLGDHCTYVPNKYYYDPSAIKWGKIVTRNITDNNTMLAAMRAGQIDVGIGDASTAPAAAAAGLKVIFAPGDWTGATLLDLGGNTQPALRDVRVRQALNYAIDRKTITQALFGKYAKPTSSMFPGATGETPTEVNYYPYNPSKAKALLAAAGYKNGFTLKIITISDYGAQFHLDDISQALVKYWGAIGVTTQVDSVPFAQFFSLFGQKTHQFLVHEWSDTSPLSLTGYPTRLAPNSFLNQTSYFDPVMNRLWLKGLRANRKEQLVIQRQMIERSVSQAYTVSVCDKGYITFSNPKKVAGVARAGNTAFDVLDWRPA